MHPPDLFTVREAAAVLRIGRTSAYELVHRDYVTGGAEGLGVVRIGGQFRIPRPALERLIGGPVSWPDDTTPPEQSPAPVTVHSLEPEVDDRVEHAVHQPQLAFDV